MKVLSLFDGISCGQVALGLAGKKYSAYWASEVDSVATSVTNCRFPDTRQLGDVNSVDFSSLGPMDLLLGGSPCQSFSVANRERKGFESQNGQLFYKYVEALNKTQPTYFLFENVASMKPADQEQISRELGVAPVFINSSDFSAQSRKRLYWTNIPVAPYEPSMEIVFDVLDHNCLDDLDPKYKDQYKALVPNRKKVDICRQPNKIGYIRRNYQGYGVYSTIGKSVSLTTGSGLGGCTGLYMIGNTIRKLNALEGERLQKMPDGYTAVGKLKDTARLRLLGNGWTASVISHILKGISS